MRDGRAKVSDITMSVLKQARDLYDMTGGAFDVTVGLLFKLYDYDDDGPVGFPEEAFLEESAAILRSIQLEIRKGR
ncbi:FAD:protein FMN transferase [Candidatus Hydrogenedentota bacterium]